MKGACAAPDVDLACRFWMHGGCPMPADSDGSRRRCLQGFLDQACPLKVEVTQAKSAATR